MNEISTRRKVAGLLMRILGFLVAALATLAAARSLERVYQAFFPAPFTDDLNTLHIRTWFEVKSWAVALVFYAVAYLLFRYARYQDTASPE